MSALQIKRMNFRQSISKAATSYYTGKMSLQEASTKYNVPKTTIWRHVSRLKNGDGPGSGENLTEMPNIHERMVFNDGQLVIKTEFQVD